MADERLAILVEFVRGNLLTDPNLPLGPGTRLLSEGLIDSLGVTALAAFVEERFGVRLDDTEIRGGENETLEEILSLIDRRCRSR
ncbi:MAG TPA: phosphopantetheine-binding protein [Candidatus Binatia bacterium]|nr:phosphopantetheine-binding protein [Candidatus Binatia bacterium]